MAVKTKEMTISLNGKTVGVAQTFSMDMGNGLIDINTISDNDWDKSIEGGGKNWSISTDGLVLRGAAATDEIAAWELADKIKAGGEIAVSIAPKTPVAGDRTMTGSGFIENLNMSGSNREVMTWSTTIKGNDEPTFGTVAS